MEENREDASMRSAIAKAVDVWNEYENGDAGPSFDEADAVLAMPKMQAIRQFLIEDADDWCCRECWVASTSNRPPPAVLAWIGVA